MKKRILSLILCISMLLSAGALSASATTDNEALPAHEDSDIAAVADAEMPRITSVVPTANGATIAWSAYDGAAKYFVFMQKPEGGWKTIGAAEVTSFEYKKVTNNTEYLFTVRAADENGAFISGYDRTGFAYRWYASPVLSSVVNVTGGQRLYWQAVDGAPAYTVYIKYPTGWKAVFRTGGTTYFNANVTSGKQYFYTVRVWDPEGKTNLSYYDRKGISGVYIAAPYVSGYSPISGGNRIKWNASAGAERYCLFMKNAGKWKALGITDKTYFDHKNLSHGTLYTYTVRCVDSNGNFVSGYDSTGVSYRYLAPPAISSVSGQRVAWEPVAFAEGYSFYRKEFGKSWELLGNVKALSFTDNTASRNTLYTYTVRCLDGDGKLISYFTSTDKYYINGALANGTYTVGGRTVAFKNGLQIKQGYTTIDGKMYYYNAAGVLQKNGLVGSSKEGWRYADKNGVINLSYTGLASNSSGTWYLKNGTLDRTLRAAVTVGGVDYNVLNGKAYKVSTTKDRTLFRALKVVARVTDSSMSKSQKLYACWQHLRTSYGERNPRIPHYHGEGWAETYANDIFVDGAGNCFSYGAAFAYLAKAIGYSNCYACNSGGHGWAEVEGLVYDPEWSMHNSGYSYYALSYDTQTDVRYKSAISAGEWWMHVAV